MRAVIHTNHLTHQREHGAALAEGFARHGIAASFAGYDRPTSGDIVVIWGWRQKAVINAARAAGIPVLVTERGYLGDRFAWTSCGWNGLNGRATFPEPADDGERFEQHFAGSLQPWREKAKGYALVCGQVPGDASIEGVNFNRWAAQATNRLKKLGYEVRYRPHPNVTPCGPLEQDLEGAALCVTFNSNSGVVAAMSGIPTVACDEGSMAWPVASHSLDEPPVKPDRAPWFRQLSWCQWQLGEIRDGTAWEHLRGVKGGA